jgi:polyhydroxyalkanoate synthesis regulator protein
LIVRRKLRVLNRGRNLTATDAEILEDIRQRSILRQQEVDLEKKTNEDLLKIINVRQLAELYFTEQEFLKRILQVLMGRAED